MPEKYICHGKELTAGTVIETEDLETFTVEKIEFNTVYVKRTPPKSYLSDSTHWIREYEFTKTKAQFRKWFREHRCTVVPTN